MSADDKKPGPQVFRLDDSRLGPADAAPIEDAPNPMAAQGGAEGHATMVPPAAKLLRFRRVGWGSIFLSAVGGLVTLGVGLWVTNFVFELFAKGGWLGYVALALAIVAAFAALMLMLRELIGIFRLGRVAAIRLGASMALTEGGKKEAEAVSRQTEALFAGRQELRWGVKRLEDHRGEILDGRELLILTERELLAPLDLQARAMIFASARRVAVVTAVSPSAILDVGMVGVETLGLIRRLATLYGGRPGFLGSLRLARLVLGHIALTGGVALGEDLIQQLLGHGLTARLSARLGEGLMNGAFTGRIGIAAIEVCRPLPFIEAERPRLRDVVAQLRRSGLADPASGEPKPTEK
jgi:putative membrane protein